VSIVTSLLDANYKENLIAKFSAKNKTGFKDLFILIHIAMATGHWSAYQSKCEVYVVNLLVVI